jgi:uncharacterized membrane protein YhaH (DUF805 family)
MSDPYKHPQGTGQQLWPSEQPRQNTGWASNPYASAAYPPPGSGPVPLWAPLYGASLGDAARRFFKKYATFTGRASRSEYWKWVAISALAGIVLDIIVYAGGASGATRGPAGQLLLGPGAIVGYALMALWTLAVIVPTLALSVRRLHDTNRSGWTYLLALIPIVGGIIVCIFMLLPSRPEGQRFDVPA